MDTVRRSANYPPPIWDYDFVQSLTSEFEGEHYSKRITKMKEDVKVMMQNTTNPMELIDTLQRLGIAYHFEHEIQTILNHMYNNKHVTDVHSDLHLYSTALKFRLFRQHGYNVSHDVFNSFKDEEGNFKPSVCDDLKGLVYLYEASYLSVPDETVMDDIRGFSSEHIIKCLKNKNDENGFVVRLARHALEFPLHWRIQRAESRWFIDTYETSSSMNPTLVHFAKLDFNLVQAIHQQDLKYHSRWWKETELGEKLDFVRDRPVEIFLWTLGVFYEPQYTYCRRMLARFGALITVIDDIYDVYGTFDELEQFTDVVTSWNIKAIDSLPNYMKLCFQVLHKCVNEIAEDIGLHILPYLRHEWIILCKSYLTEAKWYRDGYTPNLEEYLKTASDSISIRLLLVCSYITLSDNRTKDISECLKKRSNVIQYSTLIARLADDLGTSMHEQQRGDNSKAIQCYMHETGKSEELARKHIHDLIDETWKKLNVGQIQNSSPKTFMKIGMNLARIGQYFYQYGDGYGAQNFKSKNRILSLLVEAIPID